MTIERRPVADSLRDVGMAIAWVGETLPDLSEDLRYGVEVCLEEALANLILHGRPTEGEKAIELAVEADAGGARIEITDHCAPFDLVAVEDKVRVGADAFTEGGRGIGLIKAFASELAYASDDGGNHLTMTFRPSPAS